MAFKVLFAVAAYFDLNINQIDIKTTFLYGLIDQLVYVNIPKGSESEVTQRMVYKLLKALYGLKKSLYLWYERLSKFLLQKLGLTKINVDHSIFINMAGLDGSVVSIFLDNIKIMASIESSHIARVKAKLTATFSIVNMRPISFYLELKIQRDQENRMIKLFQLAYIDKVLNQFYLEKTNVVITPMKESTILQARTKEETSIAEQER